MAKIYKMIMYVCDLDDNLSVNELQDMINTYVLDRRSTDGFCLLQEVKSADIEWCDEHPLNYHTNSNNPAVWDKILNDNGKTNPVV